jgi:hypothetical protein
MGLYNGEIPEWVIAALERESRGIVDGTVKLVVHVDEGGQVQYKIDKHILSILEEPDGGGGEKIK